MHYQATYFRSLDNWFKSPQGEQVGLAFATELNVISEYISGHNLMQFAHCGNNPWLNLLRFNHKWSITPYWDKLNTSMSALYHMLPVDKECIDCIIAPLTLEAFKAPEPIIEEMDRVLKSTGIIIFFGINPLSLWGGALKLGKINGLGSQKTHLKSAFRLKRMMQHRGYQPISFTSFYFIPPVANKHHIKQLEFLNEVGKMIWPFPGGFYCLIMQKLSYPPLSPLVECLNKDGLFINKTSLSLPSQ